MPEMLELDNTLHVLFISSFYTFYMKSVTHLQFSLISKTENEQLSNDFVSAGRAWAWSASIHDLTLKSHEAK